jgi:hypothetical protein
MILGLCLGSGLGFDLGLGLDWGNSQEMTVDMLDLEHNRFDRWGHRSNLEFRGPEPRVSGPRT